MTATTRSSRRSAKPIRILRSIRLFRAASLALGQSSSLPPWRPERCSCGGAICCDRWKQQRTPRAKTLQTSRMGPWLYSSGRSWHFSLQRERTISRQLVQFPGGASAFRRNRQIALCHEKKQQPVWKDPLLIGLRSHLGWLAHLLLAGYLQEPKRDLGQPKRRPLRFARE